MNTMNVCCHMQTSGDWFHFHAWLRFLDATLNCFPFLIVTTHYRCIFRGLMCSAISFIADTMRSFTTLCLFPCKLSFAKVLLWQHYADALILFSNVHRLPLPIFHLWSWCFFGSMLHFFFDPMFLSRL
jgi:hypothetical protein